MKNSEIRDVLSIVRTKMSDKSVAEQLAYLDAHVNFEEDPSHGYQDAHALRADLLDQLGQEDAVIEELVACSDGIRYSLYPRYVHGLELGIRTGNSDWYFAALRSAICHESMPCASVLSRIVEKHVIAELSEEQQMLVRLAILASWRGLRIKRDVPVDVVEAVKIIDDVEFRSSPRPPVSCDTSKRGDAEKSRNDDC